MNTLHTLRRHALAWLALIALAGTAQAQPAAPAVSEVVNGSYTVSYDPDCYAHVPADFYCQFLYLVEQEASGVWNVVSWDTGSVSFTSKAPGTYTYFLWVGVSNYWYGYQEGLGQAITVVVPAGPAPAIVTPVRDDILTQLDYRYDVRRGDINSDGRADLFVRKVAGGTPFNGAVEEVLLRQTYVPGQFDAVVPTAGEAAYMSAWSLAPTIEARPQDIDVDGYVDVTLANVGSVIGGAPDQIVYSPGQLGQAQPGGVRAVDGRLTSFVGDAMDYFADPDYFLKNATYYFYEVWITYAYCPWLEYGGLDSYYWWQALTYCYYDHYYYYGIYADYSAFSPDAVQLWSNEIYSEYGLLSREQAMAAIETIIESVIGAPLGGWPMEELLGQVGPHVEDLIRRALEAYQSILNAARAVPERVDMDNLPPQTPRQPDVIYVTGHRLFGDLGHLALEYAGPQAVGGLYLPTTLSGAAQHWPPVPCLPGMQQLSFCGWGKLLAETDKLSDQWYLNYQVGHVIPLVGTTGTYWDNSLVPRHNRYINVPYESKPDYNAFPDAASNTYNSNGYARGLNGQGGLFVVPMDMNSVYPGWDRPVPEALFQ